MKKYEAGVKVVCIPETDPERENSLWSVCVWGLTAGVWCQPEAVPICASLSFRPPHVLLLFLELS